MDHSVVTGDIVSGSSVLCSKPVSISSYRQRETVSLVNVKYFYSGTKIFFEVIFFFVYILRRSGFGSNMNVFVKNS